MCSNYLPKNYKHLFIRIFHDKQIWQKICEAKKFLKNKFTKKLPPVGFDLPTATITALESDA